MTPSRPSLIMENTFDLVFSLICKVVHTESVLTVLSIVFFYFGAVLDIVLLSQGFLLS
jgi:hypothetical protein